MFLLASLPVFAATVTLTWTQSADPNVVSNNVYRSAVSGGPYSEIYESSTPITTYSDTRSAGTYYYVVTAVSQGGGPEIQIDWTHSTAFYSGQVICPTVGNAGGYSFYSQGADGVSGLTEPTWPQTPGATTAADGTITDWVNGSDACTFESGYSNEVTAIIPGSSTPVARSGRGSTF